MTDLNKERMELELSAGVLDRQIDNLKAEIADEYFDDQKLDDLIDMAIKLGEVYAQRDLLGKAKAQAVPEGCVLLPRVATETMANAFDIGMLESEHFFGELDAFKDAYTAMVKAAGDQK